VVVGQRQFFDVRISDVAGICVDNSGNIFVSDPIQNVIFKISQSGEYYIYAGQLNVRGNNGNNRVRANLALFNEPMGVSADPSGNIYVADRGNNQIRMITPDHYVSLVAGSLSGASGFVSGIGHNALFNQPNDVATDRSGNIFVADMGNHAVRIIKSGTSQVNTAAGNGVAGDGYGIGLQARLNTPYGVAVDAAGRVYINDSGNFKIKLLDKNFDVRKFSGSGIQGDYLGDAITSQYRYLKFSDTDKSGNLWIISMRDDGNSRLLKVNGNGIPRIVRDYDPSEKIISVIGIASCSTNQLYIAESVFEEEQFSSSSSSSSSSFLAGGPKVTEDDQPRITENGLFLWHE
jgi:sugar lactone lactonase YvrE